MKLQTKTRQALQSPQVLQSPNERAGISPVTVRRLMADLEHNYYHVRKIPEFSQPERRGLGMARSDDLPLLRGPVR